MTLLRGSGVVMLQSLNPFRGAFVDRVHELSFASAERRREMAALTYPLFATWWPSYGFEHYVDAYFSPRLERQRLQVWHDTRGELAGYAVGATIDIDVDNDRLTLFEGLMCKRADVPNLSAAMSVAFARGTLEFAMRAAYSRGRTPVVRNIVATPGGYRIIRRAFPRLYPSPELPVGQGRFARWHEALREHMGVPADPAHPCLIEAVKLELPTEMRARWERSADPGVRYFLEQCPGYGVTHEMLVLIPLEPRDIVLLPYTFLRSAASRAKYRAQRVTRAWQ